MARIQLVLLALLAFFISVRVMSVTAVKDGDKGEVQNNGESFLQ